MSPRLFLKKRNANVVNGKSKKMKKSGQKQSFVVSTSPPKLTDSKKIEGNEQPLGYQNFEMTEIEFYSIVEDIMKDICQNCAAGKFDVVCKVDSCPFSDNVFAEGSPSMVLLQ